MEIKRFIFVLALILLSTPFILGVETLGTFQQDTNIELIQVCDNCTFVNLTTVKIPNSTMLSFNINMSITQTTYNFTFQNTSNLGEYIYTTCGDPNGIFTCQSVNFEITPTGHNLDTSKSIISFIGVGIMLLFALFFFVLALGFNNTGVKLFFIGLTATTMVFTAGFILRMMKDTVGEFVSFTSIFGSFYTLLTIMLIGASLGLMLYFVFFVFHTFQKSRGFSE